MNRLEMLPPHLLLVFIFAFINNMALTSPQRSDGAPPNLRAVPPTSFSCQGRPAGYYADPEALCQAYHMCDTLEQRYSYLCPGYTLFNQKFMVCDHWHAVNCSIASQYYDLNKKIGQVPEKAVIEENNLIQAKITSPKLTTIFKINPQNSLITTAKPIKFKTTRAPIKIGTPATIRFPKINKSPTTTRVPKKTRVTTRASTTTRAPSSRTTRNRLTTKPPQRTRTSPARTRLPFLPTTRPPFSTRTTTSASIPLTPSSTAFGSPFLHNIPQSTFSPNLLNERKMHLAISARGSGLKIKFGPSHKETIDEKKIDEVKFRPLFKKTKTPFFDKLNFTISPEILTTTPISTDIERENEVSSREHLRPIGSIIPFLIPPLVESPSNPPNNTNFHFISPFLLPPAKAPVILHGENQEILTPLTLSQVRPFSISRRLGFPVPLPQITPPRFPFSKSNPDFFIPAPGLLPPLADNSLSDEETDSDSQHEHQAGFHQMTMTFPNSTMMQRRRPLEINPDCPRCHPAFLKPNECTPCVIIK